VRRDLVVKSNVSPTEVLRRHRVIAVVGASRDEGKDAHTVPRYLKEQGYRIVPVNPAAQEILGEKAYPSLVALPAEVASRVEVVEVFRPSEELAEVARQAVEMKRSSGRPFVFWAQLGLESEEAKRVLEAGGIQYVMDECMRTVHRLSFGKGVRAGSSASRRGGTSPPRRGSGRSRRSSKRPRSRAS
jgi:uncharacterized protein